MKCWTEKSALTLTLDHYCRMFICPEYSDFEKTSEGWSFRDVKVGTGETPAWGDRVVFDWSGYTIGYFGRPFEAKG
jgi:hypothetical protein